MHVIKTHTNIQYCLLCIRQVILHCGRSKIQNSTKEDSVEAKQNNYGMKQAIKEVIAEADVEAAKAMVLAISREGRSQNFHQIKLLHQMPPGME